MRQPVFRASIASLILSAICGQSLLLLILILFYVIDFRTLPHFLGFSLTAVPLAIIFGLVINVRGFSARFACIAATFLAVIISLLQIGLFGLYLFYASASA